MLDALKRVVSFVGLKIRGSCCAVKRAASVLSLIGRNGVLHLDDLALEALPGFGKNAASQPR